MTKKKVTQLSYEIIGLAIKVHKELGAGLLEGIYEDCLKYELEKNGYDVKQQLTVPIIYDNKISYVFHLLLHTLLSVLVGRDQHRNSPAFLPLTLF